ncbi:MAG: diguanylate cyclase [Solirubrobacterales bacterium]|nr:diguanylate cyclase [Solirubrobacterales bacterium]
MVDLDPERERSPRALLGSALADCAAEVAEGVLARLRDKGLLGDWQGDRELAETIARADVEATQVIGRWIETGQGASRQEMNRLKALGALIDQLSLSCLLQAYLTWRDVTIAVLEREAAAIGAGEALGAEVRSMVARSCDVALVRMAGEFDSERKRLRLRLAAEQQKLAHLALHDPLSGLANRRHLAQRLEEVLGHGEQVGLPVYFIDLDGFKAVNDVLGHESGDRLLRALASRLGGIVDPPGLAARVGGDEFVVLGSDADADDDEVDGFAEQLLAEVRRPFQFGGREILVSASLGITRASSQQRSQELLAEADKAMYLAKQRGGSRCERFEPEIGRFVSRGARLGQDLRAAIERGELAVVYQPIASLAAGGPLTMANVGSLEALARWHHPRLGPVPPSEFIPMAERSGLIPEIDNWMLNAATRQAASWREQGWLVGVAVNFSLGRVEECDLERSVRGALADSGLPGEALTLEITESRLIEDLDAALASLLALTEIGVRVAIDDFGVGYSSLSYLEALPIGSIKVDRSFIHGLSPRSQKFEVLGAIVDLAHTLDLSVVAEGVETEAELHLVQHLRCDEMQGHLLSPAVPRERIEELHAGSSTGGPVLSVG